MLKHENSGLDNTISKTFLTSIIIILVFFISPLVIDITKESIMIFSKDFENNSKNDLKKLLENQTSKTR